MKMIACVFNSRSAAESARDCLRQHGFEGARVRVEGGELAEGPNAGGHAHGPAVAPSVDRGLVGVIGRMFSGLLPDGDEVAGYAQAVNDGKYVVALDVADDAAAARAASILHECSGQITAPTGSSDGMSAAPTSPVGSDQGGYGAGAGVDVAAAVSGPRIYPLPNSPTGWGEASQGSKSSIGGTMNDPGRPEGLLRDAKGLGTDADRRVLVGTQATQYRDAKPSRQAK
ncbi:MAG: hypothetical protein ABI724_19920 [Betaproteobacteria bacterium]